MPYPNQTPEIPRCNKCGCILGHYACPAKGCKKLHGASKNKHTCDDCVRFAAAPRLMALAFASVPDLPYSGEFSRRRREGGVPRN